MVTVYSFIIWDHDESGGDNVQGPRMGTKEAITRIGGELQEGSAKVIDESELDPRGFYPKKG